MAIISQPDGSQQCLGSPFSDDDKCNDEEMEDYAGYRSSAGGVFSSGSKQQQQRQQQQSDAQGRADMRIILPTVAKPQPILAVPPNLLRHIHHHHHQQIRRPAPHSGTSGSQPPPPPPPPPQEQQASLWACRHAAATLDDTRPGTMLTAQPAGGDMVATAQLMALAQCSGLQSMAQFPQAGMASPTASPGPAWPSIRVMLPGRLPEPGPAAQPPLQQQPQSAFSAQAPPDAAAQRLTRQPEVCNAQAAQQLLLDAVLKSVEQLREEPVVRTEPPPAPVVAPPLAPMADATAAMQQLNSLTSCATREIESAEHPATVAAAPRGDHLELRISSLAGQLLRLMQARRLEEALPAAHHLQQCTAQQLTASRKPRWQLQQQLWELQQQLRQVQQLWCSL